MNTGRKVFEEKESFTHKMAKELLREWIIGGFGFYDEYLGCPISFIDEKRHTQESVNWRAQYVSLEHPITKDFPTNIDEGSACNFKNEKGEHWLCSCPYGYRGDTQYCPCLKCQFFDKSQLLYVADLAIGHKGITACIIEVSHKNPISYEKAFVLRQMMDDNCRGLTAFEIEAHHIMGQIKKPDRLFVRSF